MLERALVQVDTSYLLASFYNAWEEGARNQLEIDFAEVVNIIARRITNTLSLPIHRQLWYDGVSDSGSHRYQRALKNLPGVIFRQGQLIEYGNRRTQKGVDTRLVADMVLAAVRQQFSDIVLISGDADMLPGVEEAVSAGVRVHLFGFGLDSMSSALSYACDSTTILDPKEDFKDSMRLAVLVGPLEHEVASAQDDLEEKSHVAENVATAIHEANTNKETADQQVYNTFTESQQESPTEQDPGMKQESSPPSPAMMASFKKQRNMYVPLPSEIWSGGKDTQSPHDIGQQYATWWFNNVATDEDKELAPQLTGGGLPPEIDRPLLQFGCETLHEYTLTEEQRIGLRDGFHTAIRALVLPE